MFCKNCGKELLSNEKYCSNCGKLVTLENYSYTNNKTTIDKKSKGKITGIIPGIVLIIVLILFGSLIQFSTKDIVNIEQVLDVNQYYKSSTETISMDDLIKLKGEPEERQNWNYTTSTNTKIPLTTLSYENYTYDYIFKDNMLIRININKDIQFNSQNDLFTMFNLTKHDITTINNTGSSIRIYDTSVPDLWCGIDDNTIKWIKITFIKDIF